MRAITAACLALALLLSACSSGADETAAVPPTSSPSPLLPEASEAGSPSPAEQSAPPVEVPEPPQGRNDRRGRRAFGEYVLQAWIHALNTNDPQALLDAGGRRPCQGCSPLARELRKRDRQGWHVVLDGVQVSRTRDTADGRRGVVTLRVTIPESHSYHDDGSYRSTNPAHPRSTFEVEMRHTGRGFELVSFGLF
ncbi:MAG TPA: hypothetical protein VFZ64_09670 [Nocardioidaceae bacterium]